MADLEIKKGSTFPALKGYAFDVDGPLPLAGDEEKGINPPDKLEIRIKGSGFFISGEAEVIDPPEVDAKGNKWNYQYPWAAGDTDDLGTNFQHELWVYWDESASPPLIQKLPEHLTDNPTLSIVQDLVE
jgi:hypothetical protein